MDTTVSRILINSLVPAIKAGPKICSTDDSMDLTRSHRGSNVYCLRKSKIEIITLLIGAKLYVSREGFYNCISSFLMTTRQLKKKLRNIRKLSNGERDDNAIKTQCCDSQVSPCINNSDNKIQLRIENSNPIINSIEDILTEYFLPWRKDPNTYVMFRKNFGSRCKVVVHDFSHQIRKQ